MAIVLGCYLCGPQDYTYIQLAYWGIIFLFFAFSYDFKDKKTVYGISCVIVVLICMSKLAYISFVSAVAILIIFLRKQLSVERKRIFWIVIFSGLVELVFTIIIKHGLDNGVSIGTIQKISIGELLAGSVYFSTQIYISALFQELNFANAMLINVLVASFIFITLFYAIREVVTKGRYVKRATFLIALYMLNCGNCACQMLTNPVNMIPKNVNWNNIYYIPVDDKLRWYLFSYISVYLYVLIIITILRDNMDVSYTRQNPMQNIIRSFLVVIMALFFVNQYAYRGSWSSTYKAFYDAG